MYFLQLGLLIIIIHGFKTIRQPNFGCIHCVHLAIYIIGLFLVDIVCLKGEVNINCFETISDLELYHTKKNHRIKIYTEREQKRNTKKNLIHCVVPFKRKTHKVILIP